MSSSEMTHICLIQLRRRERETRKREEGEKLIGIKSFQILHHIHMARYYLFKQIQHFKNNLWSLCNYCVISIRLYW